MRPDLVRSIYPDVFNGFPFRFAFADIALLHRKFVNDVQRSLAGELAGPGMPTHLISTR